MTFGGATIDSEQRDDRGQLVRRLAPPLFLSVAVLLLGGCAGLVMRPDASPADAEAQMPSSPAIALEETDGPNAEQAELTEATRPIWDRLRAGYRFSEIRHPRIDREIRLLRRSPNAFVGLMVRGEPYLYHILDAVERAGLPTELALLPAVESGFRPHAYSPDGAAGLWQFMPATGRMLGLKQDWWFDRRRTVRASTTAAIRHLQLLNKRFSGDWLHALAAYNAGSAKVSRAIRRANRRNDDTAFWSLDLPGETDRYVPRLLALARVVADPQRYGLELPEIPDRPYFAIADTAGQIDLTVAAAAAGMPIEELLGLNAGHRRWATRPDGPHELLLPVARAEAFAAALADLPDDKRLRWQRHRIRPGDSLNRIAHEYGVTAEAIRRANGMRSSLIRAGRDLMIPLSDSVTFAKVNQMARQRLRYRVRKGDSLYTIARRFQVTVRDLRRWNRVGRYIRPGERLTVFIDPDA